MGNHEFYADAELRRYLDQTWEKWAPLKEASTDSTWANHILEHGESNAKSHIGAFLNTGLHHAAGMHGPVPSNTSRYFSVDFGLVHLVGLTLNGYNGVDTCTTTCNEQQKAWLAADLAAVDRTKTPWVIAFSHFPIYLSEKAGDEYDTGVLEDKAWLNAEECEYCGHCLNCTDVFPQARDYTPVQPADPLADDKKYTLGDARSDLEPLFYQYGVDICIPQRPGTLAFPCPFPPLTPALASLDPAGTDWAGHIHFYQTFHGPLKDGKLVSEGTHNPKGVIHVCSGNGGPPSPSSCSGHTDKLCIAQPYSYTQLVAHNATDLTWKQISNKDNSVIDEWVLHQDSHGPFV